MRTTLDAYHLSSLLFAGGSGGSDADPAVTLARLAGRPGSWVRLEAEGTVSDDDCGVNRPTRLATRTFTRDGDPWWYSADVDMDSRNLACGGPWQGGFLTQGGERFYRTWGRTLIRYRVGMS